jgi:hypothetical protein
MKQFLLAAAAVWMSVCASAAGLGEIKTVYLLPMSGGLDQYLAVQLTTGSVLQVVTDPQKAGAVFTDHVGELLEQTLAELYGDKTKTADKAADKTEGSPQAFVRSGMQGQRGRGTIFLVDRKNREVVWSNYERLKDMTPDGLKRTAGQIASKLARAIKGK